MPTNTDKTAWVDRPSGVPTRLVAWIALPLGLLLLIPGVAAIAQLALSALSVLTPTKMPTPSFAWGLGGIGLNLLGLGIWCALSKANDFTFAVRWWARIVLSAGNLVIAIAVHLAFGAGLASTWYLSAAFWFVIGPFVYVLLLPFMFP